MVVFPGLSQPLEAAGKQITSWDDGGSRLVVDAASIVRWAACPRCAYGSARPHGRYRRWVADSPCFGQPVTLAVEIRRFKCINAACPQRTFSERIETLAATGRRRTLRLAEGLRSLGYALGGQAAARLAARLGICISGPTVLRELRRAGCPPPATAPVIIGINDWAIARGHRYGTIVVDLQRRQPIELLPGRDVATVVPWLRATPGVEIIARDRAGAYADAAQQVADRWHLLANLRDAIERLLLRCTPQMRQAAHEASEAMHLGAEPAEMPAAPGSLMPVEPQMASQRRSAAAVNAVLCGWRAMRRWSAVTGLVNRSWPSAGP